jgi:PAS domain S-box-containing protein
MGIAQALDGIMRMSASADTALQWSEMTAATWIFITPFEVLFIFRYTGWSKKISDATVLTFLFSPAIILSFLIIAGLHKTTALRSEQWNWIINPQDTFVTNAAYLWGTILSLASFIMYWIYYIKVRKNKYKKTFSLLIAVGNSIPFVMAITAEVILPVVFKMDDIPISTPSIAIFSISILVAITKYKVFDYSPKHQWKNILETMNEGVLIVNNNDEIMYANKKLCEQLGYELNELKGKVARNLLTKEVGAEKIVLNAIEERKEKRSTQYEMLLKTKSGQKTWALISGSPYLDINGNVIGSIGIHTNIDELKLANSELKLFVYKASHDLRGPLASVLGLIGLIKQEKDKNEIMNYVEMIGASAKKLDTTLLTLTKSMEIREVKELKDKVDLEKLLKDVLERFEGYEGFDRMEIRKKISIKTPTVSSKVIMESIFQNIIENAIKYQNASIGNPFLEIYISESENGIELIFEDNGQGIGSESIPKIFDMYYRGSEKSKGSGLGLYLVKNGVDKLCGTIKVDSEMKKGTRFKILLPRR